LSGPHASVESELLSIFATQFLDTFMPVMQVINRSAEYNILVPFSLVTSLSIKRGKPETYYTQTSLTLIENTLFYEHNNQTCSAHLPCSATILHTRCDSAANPPQNDSYIGLLLSLRMAYIVIGLPIS